MKPKQHAIQDDRARRPEPPRRTGGARFFRLVPFAAIVVVALVSLSSPLPPSALAGSSAGASAHPLGTAQPLPRYVNGRATSGIAPILSSPSALASSGLSPVPMLRSLAHAGTDGPTPAAAGQSTAANWYIDNYSSESWVANVGNSNSTLDVAGASVYDLIGGPGGTIQTSFWKTGISASYRSTDSGRTWTKTYIPGNVSHWQTSSDISYGSVTWGDGVVRSNATGTLLYSTLYGQPCYFLGGLTCNSTVNYTAPLGVAVGRSTNGGQTWNSAVVVNALRPYRYVYVSSTCNGFLPANMTDKPFLAMNGANNVAVAGWTVYSYSTHVDTTNCTYSYTFNIIAQVSVSTDGGLTWGTPVTLGGQFDADPQIQIGPGPTYPIYALWNDFQNSTNTTFTLELRVSTNNGTSWSTGKDIGTATLVNAVGNSAPDAFRATTLPSFAVDSWSGSPYKGALYVTWNDNRTGAYTGYPAVAFVESQDGGATWSAVRYISAQYPATPAVTYLQPTVAVAPNGSIWVAYYGVNQTTGNYRVYDTLSLNAGTSFTPETPVSDAASVPGALGFIGDYLGVAATNAGAYTVWTDCRAADCSTSGDTQFFAAELNVVTISSNATGINATVNSLSIASKVSLPVHLGWDVNSTDSVTVPASARYNATYFWGFTKWTGLSTSTNFQATVVYPGSGFLTAIYQPVPASFIAGTVSPATAKVTLNGAPVSLTAYNSTANQFNISVASGSSYTVAATAAKYTPFSQLTGTTPFRTTTVNIVLPKIAGWIAGSINQHNASLTVNGTAVAVNATTGLFNESVPWGFYWVRANESGLTNFSQYVQVNPSVTTSLVISLTGGWIAGSVSPPNAGSTTPTVTVDGLAVSVSFGAFNASVIGGVHVVRATLPGYNTSSNVVSVTPGHTTVLSITLSDKGWVAGTIAPSAALKSATLKIGNLGVNSGSPQPFNRTSGGFNITVSHGTWTVTVASPGYNTTWQNVTVTAGNMTTVSFTLATAPCTGTSCNPSNNTTKTGTQGLSLYVYVGIGVAVLVVAAVAALLLMRRRRQPPAAAVPGGEGAETPPESVYGGSTSELPRLGSDGTLEGPPGGSS